MSRIIAVANQKGGVGKSATTINLSACLAELNKKILIIDMDPQQHVNLGLGIDPREIKSSTYNLLVNPQMDPSSAILKYSENVCLLPSHLDLAAAESELMGKVASDRRLLNQLSKIKDKFDFIFIDCPPSLGLLTINSLIASEEVLIPIEPEYLAMQGVVRLVKLLNEIGEAHQKKMVYYTLITMYDSRTNFAKEVCNEIKTKFGTLCLNTKINTNVKIKEAMSQGMPVSEYDRNSKGYLDYSNLAHEINDMNSIIREVNV